MKLLGLFVARKKTSKKRGRLVLPPAEYHELLRRIFRRDKHKCRCCRLRRELHGHHLKYRSAGGDDIEYNLLSLCEPCHEAEHQRYLVILHPEEGREGVPLDANGPLKFVALGGWTPGERIRKKK